MKHFTCITALSLIAGWLANSAFAVEYRTDFLEPDNPGGVTESLKTFDDEWTIGVGETFSIDVWAADIPEEIISSGFEMLYNPAQMRLVSVKAFDGDADGSQGNPVPCCPGLTGPWDPVTTNQLVDPYGPGSYALILAQLGTCPAPDAGGDVIIGRVTFQCLAEGSSDITVQAIDGFDTTVGCTSSVVYDSQMGTHTITIFQDGTGPSTTTSSPSTTTSSISSSTTSSPPTTSSPSTTTTTIKRCLSESIYGGSAEETRLLRTFRNRVLSQTAEGRELINLYYLWSPAIVSAMEGNEEFQAWVKEMIDDALPMIQEAVE